MIDPKALAAEIAKDPVGLGYAAMLPACPGHVIDALNAPTFTMIRSRRMNATSVFSALGSAGATILDAIESFSLQAASNIPQIEALRVASKWAIRFLQMDTGMDVGDPVTLQTLAALAQIGILTADQVAAVQGLAVQPASRAEVLFGAGSLVSQSDLSAAGVTP